MFMDSIGLRFRELHVDCFNTARVARCLNERANDHCRATLWTLSLLAVIAAAEKQTGMSADIAAAS
jgi:hypothetical protein